MKVFLFPGQGTQRQGMGKDVFDAFPELTRQADDLLGYAMLQEPHVASIASTMRHMAEVVDQGQTGPHQA